ncbi:MAG: double zinc ribbon domain-containing protein [Oscillospiraceae bacterium]|nr:double zinc ribbon domain-containing protein [Oscillospiraceae bacterium]
MSFFSSIIDLLFPPKCVFCRRVLDSHDDAWCSKCTETLPFTLNSGKQEGEYYDYCISPLHYVDAVRKSILRYKFNGASSYADVYGRILAECIRENPDIGYDVISWVPLSSDRKRTRGYDQAMLLALATALELDDVAIETLIKPRDVRAQSELMGREARSANISGAYEIADPELIEGKCVLLIDDIVTTGSTLSECAKVLLSAGAARVVCAALARGE